MQLPICDVCLTSNILCGGCNERLERGDITLDDVEVSRYLFGLSDKYKTLDNVKLVRAINSDILLMIAASGHGSKLVGRGGVVVKDVAKKFDKPIRVLEEACIEKFIQDLLSPAVIIGINTLYSSGGEIQRIRIPRDQKNRVLLSKENFSNIINDIFGKRVELIFE